jgi:HAD superfamily hydrolase (TIGR01549 family)
VAADGKDGGVIRAVLFDMDGTLYLQPPLRAMMAGELAVLPWLQRAPWRVRRLWTALSIFRSVREDLRALGHSDAPLSRLQYSEAARRAGLPESELEAEVAEWIVQRPLKYLPHLIRSGTREALATLKADGVQIGVFSDYPARDKLKAMALDHMVSLVVDATEADVNAFKPHPRGFLAAAARWGLEPGAILYVGDRPEVDAVGAVAAGMRCAVIGAARQTHPGEASFARVARMADIASIVARDGRP